MSTLSLNQLSKQFKKVSVIRDLSLDIPTGSLSFLLGASGSGKSTVLRIIAGLEKQDTGTVSFNGTSLDKDTPQKRGIGFVFQNYALWPHLTVQAHIEFGLKLASLSDSIKKARFHKVIELSQLGPYLSRYPHELSGGQQQRVAVARALVLEPQILLLDEPLANLDPALRHRVLHEIVQLNKELKITIVYVTHNRDECLAAGDFAAFLQNGSVLQSGTPKTLYNSPAHLSIAQFSDETYLLTPDDVPSLFSRNIKEHTHFALRPHMIQLKKKGEPSEQPHSLTLPANIVRVEFQGSYSRVTARLQSGQEISVHDTSHCLTDSQQFSQFELTFNQEDLLHLSHVS